MTTIRENAVDALRELYTVLGPRDARSEYLNSKAVMEDLFGPQTIKQERRMNTIDKNKELDESLCELLVVLSGTHDSAEPHGRCVLHILEYLLRRYEIHIFNKTADKLLTTYLAQHESNLFSRILQLIDLALVDGNTWVFARPFAAKNAPTMTRPVIAQRIANDDALLSKLLLSTQSLVKNCISFDTSTTITPAGVNKVLSFVGAVVTEGLTYQAHMVNKAQITPFLKESTVRLMLPFLLSTFDSTCPEFKNLGYVITCVMADLCVMVSGARELIATKMVKGIKSPKHELLKMEVDDGESADEDSEMEDSLYKEQLADCLVILNVLLVHGKHEAGDETYCGFPLLPKSGHDENLIITIGCSMPLSTYLALCRFGGETLASALADAAQDQDMSFLLAALLKQSVSYLSHPEDSTRLGRNVFVALTNDQILRSSAWMHHNILPSVTAFLLVEYTKAPKTYLPTFSKCLNCLHKADPDGCDLGTNHFISSLERVSEDKSKDLERVDELMRETFGSKQEDANLLLRRLAHDESPKNVAAAFKSYRDMLKAAQEAGNDTSKPVDMRLPTATEALNALRKWGWMDDYEIEEKIFKSKKKIAKSEKTNEEQESKAVTSGRTMTVESISALCAAIDLCALATEHDDTTDEEFDLLVQAIVCHSKTDLFEDSVEITLRELNDDLNDMICDTINRALVRILENAEETVSNDLDIKMALATTDLFLDLMKDTVADIDHNATRKNQDAIVERYLRVALSSVVINMESNSSSATQTAVNTTLELCMHVLRRKDSRFKLNKKTLARCFLTCINTPVFHKLHHDHPLDAMAEFLSDLALAEKTSTFKKILSDIIDPLLKRFELDTPALRQAVILEVCSRPAIKPEAVVVLLTHCSKEGSKFVLTNGTTDLLILLALFTHNDLMVRKQATDILSESINAENMTNFSSVATRIRELVINKMKPKIQLDGVTHISSLLKDVSKYHHKASECLIQQCALVCKSCDYAGQKGLDSPKTFFGGYLASSTLLSVLRDCGNDVFPLEDLWERGGKSILEHFLDEEQQIDESNDRIDDVFKARSALVEVVCRMLKGSLVCEGGGQDVAVTIGPSSAGRGRSRTYSFCDPDKVSVISPYPESMTATILRALEQSLKFSRKTFVHKVILDSAVCSKTWSSLIFPSLSKEMRRNVTKALLLVREKLEDRDSIEALVALPIEADDLVTLMKSSNDTEQSRDAKLLSLSYLADCICKRASSFDKPNTKKLVGVLFGELRSLSVIDQSREDLSQENSDYTRLCVLKALLSLCEELSKKKSIGKSPTKAKRSRSRSTSFSRSFPSGANASLLINILGPEGTREDIIPLKLRKANDTAILLFVSFCNLDPENVAPLLLPAMIKIASTSTSSNGANLTGLRHIVLCFINHKAASGVTASEFVSKFAWNATIETVDLSIRSELLDQFVHPILEMECAEKISDALSSLFSGMLAIVAHKCIFGIVADHDEMNTLKGLCARKLLQCSAKHQLSTAFCLLRHAGALISALGENSPDIDDRESKLEDGALHLSTKSLICIALQGPNHEGKVDASEKEMTPTEFRCIMLVTANILALARNTLSSPSAKKMIRNEQEDAKVCLELWRELMHILNRVQSNIGDDEFWNAGRQLLQDCLSLLQRLLPVPHFLASVMALVKDEDLEPKLRRKALLVLGERGAEVSPRSGEGLLFLETITDLLSICSDSKISLESTDKRQISLHQSAFMAIEGLARSICVPKIAGLLSTRESTILQSALDKISLLASEFVAQLSANLQAFQESSTSFVHLISSSLLCSATLASLLGAKALPALKRLISTITSVLKIVGPNSFALTENENTGPQESMLLLISSTLRALAALIDSVPQFLGPYLPEFFEVSVFSSRNLRCHIELRQHVEKIEEALASNIPARQLIPAVATNLTKAMKISDESSWKEVQNLLHLMEMSIKKSSKSDLAAVMSKSISAIMTAATYSEEVGRFMILSSASQALVALVMKLSESQLRPLFLKMREWKGDLSSDRNDSRDSLQSSVRRYAFWTITAKLTTELRSLFLPCLSAVVTDLVDELVRLCEKIIFVVVLKGLSCNYFQNRNLLHPDYRCMEIQLKRKEQRDESCPARVRKVLN